jgi:DNA-binding XRE family transcriptional regulator
MTFRHLDSPCSTPVTQLGPAALDDLLERGDLETWAPIARAIRAEPWGHVADTVLRLCDAHSMYGTSSLWRHWITRLRQPSDQSVGVWLASLRTRAGLSQQQVADRMGISQSDVSKLERRTDMKLSTVRSYVEAIGDHLELTTSSR